MTLWNTQFTISQERNSNFLLLFRGSLNMLTVSQTLSPRPLYEYYRGRGGTMSVVESVHRFHVLGWVFRILCFMHSSCSDERWTDN